MMPSFAVAGVYGGIGEAGCVSVKLMGSEQRSWQPGEVGQRAKTTAVRFEVVDQLT